MSAPFHHEEKPARPIPSGSLNPDEILPSLLDLARRTVPADAYAVWRILDNVWRIVRSFGLSAEYQRIVRPPSPDPFESPVVLEDTATAPLPQAVRDSSAREGIRSLLAVPLSLHGVCSGSLSFYYRRPRRFDENEIALAKDLGRLAAAAIGTAELYEEQTRLRARAEDAERRSTLLTDATAALGSSLDYETTLAQVARMAVPLFADWCGVEMAQPDGSTRLVALAHTDPAKADWGLEFHRRYPPQDTPDYAVARVFRTGRSVLMPEIPDDLLVRAAQDDEHLRLLRQVGYTSSMCVPISARDRVLGVMQFVAAESGRHYGEADLAVAEHLGRRAALAIDNALLYQSAERERATAQASLEYLRRSEAKFKRLVESGIIGIIVGEHDRITEANDVFLEMLGYTREELARGNLNPVRLTAPRHAETDARARQTLLDEGACPPFEKEFLRKDGSAVPVLLGMVLTDPLPRFAWVAFVLDLTDRKRLEERLREAQKLESIGLLAGGVAHDFNNILTGILGNASLALEELSADSPLRSTLDNVVQASERAADLTRQLLAYSGKGRFVLQPVDLSEQIRELVPLLKMSIPKKVDLRLDLAPELPPVEADPAQMQQLIMNLVLNAAEAIGDASGTVLACTRAEQVGPDYVASALTRQPLGPGRYVCFEVEDTGSGIDPDTMSRIFDPFFTTKFTGRGLGLAAAAGIVRSHGGDIRVWSQPGRGSRFRVLIPHMAGVQPARRSAPETAAEALHGSGTILVVDDEEVVLKTGRLALERFGYRVVTARNGHEAVDLFHHQSAEFSLVLLDMTMPVMNGEEALERMRAVRPEIPVIVSSGYSEIEAVRRFGGSAGGVSFIQKPYTAARLAERVKQALEGEARALGSSDRG